MLGGGRWCTLLYLFWYIGPLRGIIPHLVCCYRLYGWPMSFSASRVKRF